MNKFTQNLTKTIGKGIQHINATRFSRRTEEEAGELRKSIERNIRAQEDILEDLANFTGFNLKTGEGTVPAPDASMNWLQLGVQTRIKLRDLNVQLDAVKAIEEEYFTPTEGAVEVATEG